MPGWTSAFRAPIGAPGGRLTKQGSPHLPGRSYEAAQSACRERSATAPTSSPCESESSPPTRASLTVARKLAGRCFHTLRELGPLAIEDA